MPGVPTIPQGCTAEVHQHRMVVVVNDDMGQFDVSMDNSAFVAVSQHLQTCTEIVGSLAQRESALLDHGHADLVR